jgi:hypothetical protein
MTKRQDYLAKLIKTTYCRHLHVPNITQKINKNEKSYLDFKLDVVMPLEILSDKITIRKGNLSILIG